MTIAVTQFVAAAAKAPSGTSSTSSADGLPADGDFAGILLGQVPPPPQTAAPLTDDSAAELPPGTQADAEQLFAALGLPFPGSTELPPVDAGPATPRILEGSGSPLSITAAFADGTPDAPSMPWLRGDAIAADAEARLASSLLGAATPFAAARPEPGGAFTVVPADQLASGLLGAATPFAAARPEPGGAVTMALSDQPASGLLGAAAPFDSARPELGGGPAYLSAKLAGADVPTATAGQDMNASGSGMLAVQFGGTTQTGAEQASSATATAMQLATPVRDAAWPAEFAQKVTWMARQDLQSAQITLNPPQLGPIEISLDVRNDQASAVFVSASAEVREAIESAVPRLREMLAGVGVELGQTNVSHESFHNREHGTPAGNSARAREDAAEAGGRSRELGDAGRLQAGNSGRGLVDTFA